MERKILAGFPVGRPVPEPHFWATLSKCWICSDSIRSLSQDGMRHAKILFLGEQPCEGSREMDAEAGGKLAGCDPAGTWEWEGGKQG